MTQKQKECLDFIKGFIAKHDRGPRMREIADDIVFKSTSQAFRLVRALEERGEIFVGPKAWRYSGPRGISVFQEISRGPDGILKYASWPTT